MSSLQLFNSLTRKKESFAPLNPAHVRLYACGPTVYNYAHIGNARMAVVFDLLTRVLKSLYPKVTYVSNITDVDDKIIASHKATGEPIDVITRKYEKIYNDDMAALGCAAPDIQPRATEHIGEMIAMIEALIERGHAYAADGHVLFNVPSFPAYGGLSGRSRDEQVAGARVEVASYKKDSADFVLWKPSETNEPGWDSPWGRGRPGWHIECSAMSAKHLGLPFDIHGGGADLKFPHHENEIAQSCCASGHEDDLSAFAKVWVHNGFVTVEGEKMSKSLGNFLLAHDLIKDVPGPVLRLALLSAHYRQPLDWSEQVVHQAQKLYDKILRAWDVLKDVAVCEESIPQKDPVLALYDDLNTPKAIGVLNSLLNSIFVTEPQYDLPSLKYILLNTLEILGVELVSPEAVSAESNSEIDALLEERSAAKAAKDFTRADEIRDELVAQGIEIIDTPEGAKWRKISYSHST
ncbi:MAG: cysteine--tRNA ligase [Rhodospirillales bacterium]|nr:cysteine--tRNA ligase [Alphaproteobacteria bacterium]MCB9981932.1 cysteine--tRNA ligase [Rhodospirillales bacterium]